MQSCRIFFRCCVEAWNYDAVVALVVWLHHQVVFVHVSIALILHCLAHAVHGLPCSIKARFRVGTTHRETAGKVVCRFTAVTRQGFGTKICGHRSFLSWRFVLANSLIWFIVQLMRWDNFFSRHDVFRRPYSLDRAPFIGLRCLIDGIPSLLLDHGIPLSSQGLRSLAGRDSISWSLWRLLLNLLHLLGHEFVCGTWEIWIVWYLLLI